MTADEAPTPAPKAQRPRARRAVWLLLLTLAIAAAVGLTLSQGSGAELANTISATSSAAGKPAATAGTASGTATPGATAAAPTTPSSQPATTPAPPGAGTVVPPSAINNPKISAPVKTAVAGFITQAGQISTDKIAAPSPGASGPTVPAVDFSAVAQGAALGELEAQNQEFASNGWQQSGTVTVVGTPSVSTQDVDGTAQTTVTACLDSSAVQIVDNTGATVLKAEKPGTRKNLNTYAVQQVSGAWVVVDHTFPADPHC